MTVANDHKKSIAFRNAGYRHTQFLPIDKSFRIGSGTRKLLSICHENMTGNRLQPLFHFVAFCDSMYLANIFFSVEL